MGFWRGATEERRGAAAATLQVDGAPGVPMHHELLSPLARALAFLQHPSHHPRPHTLALRPVLLSTAKISNCCSCFARRWDLRRWIQSLWWTTRSPCSRYVPATLALRCWRRCRLRLLRGRVLGGALLTFRAREPEDGRLAQSMSWSGHMHALSLCNYIFR